MSIYYLTHANNAYKLRKQCIQTPQIMHKNAQDILYNL